MILLENLKKIKEILLDLSFHCIYKNMKPELWNVLLNG